MAPSNYGWLMSLADVKETAASLSLQERFELAAFLAELDEQREAEFRHAVVQRLKTMDEGKKVLREEVEARHYQRLANEIHT